MNVLKKIYAAFRALGRLLIRALINTDGNTHVAGARVKHFLILFLLLPLPVLSALAQTNGEMSGRCGELVKVETHDGTTTRYALAQPQQALTQDSRIALVLLVGGGGHLDLDERGCPRELTGNSLVRFLPLFHDAGFITALVDAPSDYFGGDGLGGFRIAGEHAQDLGKVIADVRARTNASVWLVGTSRGSISAVNAAARLSGPAAPDGLVITSAVTSGYVGGRKEWVAQTVFDASLENIRIPILIVGHAEDKCARTPPDLMERITARTNGVREQVVTVTGGPGEPGPQSVRACRGRSPHGYVSQEAEVAAGIARFIRGGTY